MGRTGGFGDFKRYVINEVLPVYTRLGFENKANDSFMDISLRELVRRLPLFNQFGLNTLLGLFIYFITDLDKLMRLDRPPAKI